MRSSAKPSSPRIVLLAGGLGGARLAPALARELGPGKLTVVANVGDDLDWMGLRVCPDFDSILYALAGVWDAERGWGRRDETFHVRDALEGFDRAAWFAVGDRDLALHLERTRLLRGGRTSTDVGRELASRLGVRGTELVPASDAPSPTRLRLRDGRLLDFQEWYVRERAAPEVEATELSAAPAAPAALDALARADAVVLGPSNPVTSIGAILAHLGLEQAVKRVATRIAISPVVIGRRSTSPSVAHHSRARSRVLAAVGVADRPAPIASRYRGIVDWFLVDDADAAEAEAIREIGVRVETTGLLEEAGLARAVSSLAARQTGR